MKTFKDRVRQHLAVKQARLGEDYLGATMSSHLLKPLLGPGLAPFPSVIGSLHGYTTSDIDVPSNAKGILPGVGDSRLVRRARKVRKKTAPDAKYQKGRIFSDNLAVVSPMVSLAILGAALEASTGGGPESVNRAARMGMAAGVGMAGTGALLALIKRKRTLEEQAEAERKSGLLNYLIPGRGAYEWWKRIGASTHFDEKKEKTDVTPT